MKCRLYLFLALLSLPIHGSVAAFSSAAQSGTQTLLKGIRQTLRHCTLTKTIATATAATSLCIYKKYCDLVKSELERLEKKSLEYPIPDCQVKRNITQKLAGHGYEVFFVRQSGTTHNAAVLSSGKKVAFLVFDNGAHTFFTDPDLADARDGIIEHEIGHVLHGDINQRGLSISVLLPLAAACTCYAAIKAGSFSPTSFIKNITAIPSISNLGSSAYTSTEKVFNAAGSHAARYIPTTVLSASSNATEKLLSTGIPFSTIGTHALNTAILTGEMATKTIITSLTASIVGITSLLTAVNGFTALSRYQEKRADYAAVRTLKNPAALEGMAHFFEKLAKNEGKTKGVLSWFLLKTFSSHPCSCDRHQYLKKEAVKMRLKQQQAA